jgi:precorrin-6B methylase 2
VVSEAGRVRHYVVVVRSGLAGVAARDGKLLWHYEKVGQGNYNCDSPLVSGNHVFCGLGYGRGFALLEVTAAPVGGGVKSQERYFLRKSLPNWHETTTLVGEHVYASANNATVCIQLTTGKVVWEKRTEAGANVSVTCADGHLYLRSQRGKVLLIEASPKGYALKGTLQIPDAQPKLGATAPVVAGGRLYLRDDDVLFCYDVKGGARPGRPGETVVPPGTGTGKLPRPGREADAVFVPTPQDVVEKMLELAAVKKTDVVCDLGCGDGRIVVTAARKYDCKALGYDIDPQCVRMSQENVRKNDVGRLVRIEQKDIFTLDLSAMDVVTLYLLPRMNERLLPQLAKLKAGARVVCHANAIPGIRPERVVTVVSREDELPHKVYVYVAPLKKDNRPK